jgi:hypothetical protein
MHLKITDIALKINRKRLDIRILNIRTYNALKLCTGKRICLVV